MTPTKAPAGDSPSLASSPGGGLAPRCLYSLRRFARPILAGLLLAVWATATPAQDVEAGRRRYGFCVACHGIEGRAGKPLYPILAGQREAYLRQELDDFGSGLRRDPNMSAVVATLDGQAIRNLAAFFASRERGDNAFVADAAKAARGRRRAEALQCLACHGGAAAAVAGGRVVPRIDGQNPAYLAKQLADFRTGRRRNDGGLMAAPAASLSDADIDDLAAYFAARR